MTTTPRPRPARPSAARLERKVDALTDRVSKLDLNGSAATLKKLAEATPTLSLLAARADVILLLADAAPSLLSTEMTDMRADAFEHRVMVSRFMKLLPQLLERADVEATDAAGRAWLWKWVKTHLKPWKPIGAAIWTVFLVILGGAAAGYFYFFFQR